jgi:hypothetical protein
MATQGKEARIDLGELEKLAALHCTDEELAAWFHVSVRTIERRRKDKRFAETIERGRAKGKISLRRTQMRLAEQGNPALAIWLGKQLLGQTETSAPYPAPTNNFVLVPVSLPSSLLPTQPVRREDVTIDVTFDQASAQHRLE